MAVTSWTLAWAILAAPAAGQSSDLVPINKRNFKIPIIVEPSKRPQIKLLKLLVSADEGKTWSEVAIRTPDQDHFAYYAQADGVYWFTVSVVDQQDHQLPADPYQAPPNQKILVDTTPPVVQLKSAARQGDEVSVSWEIKEDNADLESLKLEYRPTDAPTSALWYAVPISRELSGTARIRLESPVAVTVRLELKDQAGNSGSDKKEVAAGAAPEKVTAAASPAAGPAVPAAAPPGTGSPLLPPAALPESRGPARVDSWPAMERPPLPVPPRSNPLSGGTETTQRVVAWSPNPDPGPAGVAPASFMPRGSLPGVLLVNDAQVSLGYELKAGPSGVKKVELFITDDDGQAWRLFTEDEDKKSPVTIRLPGEGVYGFRLVVTSGADLSEGPPQPGAAPDTRIEVDTTPPTVQLYEPKPDPQRADVLILQWTSTDRNLASKPVSLEFAEPDGTWQSIATGQPASGSLPWQMPRPLSYVHFRVTALDNAGNRSVAQTGQPILVDLHKPKGRIVGLSPSKRP